MQFKTFLFRALRGLTAAACLGAAAAGGNAQTAPHKPLKIIVPYAPGGILDTLMRRMGPLISESIGQPVIIDNRPGGLTNIGMLACAGAPADGSTVCFALEDSTVYNPLLFKRMPYDPSTLVPVIQLATARSIIVAKSAAPFNTYKEMVAFAKSKPGVLNFGTWGPASTPDLYRQWMDRSAGIDMTSVPYKGVAGGTMQAILAGEIDASVFTIGQVQAYLKDGKAKPIVILGDKRWSGMPNLTTLGEEGAEPGLTSVWGVYAPPKTPKDQVDRLNAEFAKALTHASVRELLQTNTLDPVGGTSEDFGKVLRDLRANAQRVFKALDIKPMDMPS
ncbi:MAG: tripartite tricarboxylate transporter substrate binding protein [Ottowia sp.]|uniref:Bug family tripartite tricarboxylate transporter substrate binding protein n=1 Tax=Ottowia sp. TaxID=1898956 RepID=UPI003C77ACC2